MYCLLSIAQRQAKTFPGKLVVSSRLNPSSSPDLRTDTFPLQWSSLSRIRVRIRFSWELRKRSDYGAQHIRTHSLTCYDDSLARHGSISFALGPSEEGLCEERVAPQQHRGHNQQLDHLSSCLPPPKWGTRHLTGPLILPLTWAHLSDSFRSAATWVTLLEPVRQALQDFDIMAQHRTRRERGGRQRKNKGYPILFYICWHTISKSLLVHLVDIVRNKLRLQVLVLLPATVILGSTWQIN